MVDSGLFGPTILWEMAIGTESDGYRLRCEMTEDHDAEQATVRVIENGAELEQQTFSDTPETWQEPHKYADRMHKKYFQRGMDGMQPFYLRRFKK